MIYYGTTWQLKTVQKKKKLMTRLCLRYQNISHEVFFQRSFFREYPNHSIIRKRTVTSIFVGPEKIATVYFSLTRLRISSQFLLHESKDRIFYSVMNNDNLI